MTHQFNIIAIDGGGIRGVYPAYILRRIEEIYAVNLRERFQLFAGTSTGAIIASGLAVGLSARRVFELYQEVSTAVFKMNKFTFGGMFRPLYDADVLRKLLYKEFGEIKMSEVTERLILPATDIGNGQVHILKSGYDRNFVRDSEVKLYDAVISSCSAPRYFKPSNVGPYCLADGGLWANNPSLVAVTEAVTRLNISKDAVRILSLGTGISTKRVSSNHSNWGFLTGWGFKTFIDILFNLQVQAVENAVALTMPPENYLRINFKSDFPLGLDNLKQIPDLIARADSDLSKNIDALSNLLNLRI